MASCLVVVIGLRSAGMFEGAAAGGKASGLLPTRSIIEAGTTEDESNGLLDDEAGVPGTGGETIGSPTELAAFASVIWLAGGGTLKPDGLTGRSAGPAD